MDGFLNKFPAPKAIRNSVRTLPRIFISAQPPTSHQGEIIYEGAFFLLRASKTDHEVGVQSPYFIFCSKKGFHENSFKNVFKM